MVKTISSIGASNVPTGGGGRWEVDNPVNPQKREFTSSNFEDFDPRMGQGMGTPLKESQIRGRQVDPSIVAARRQAAMEAQEQSELQQTQEARTRVEIITGLGRKTRDVPVDGAVFTLRTLKFFERTMVSEVVESAERVPMGNGKFGFAPTSLAAIRKETLAHCLQLIDGKDVNVILGTSQYDYGVQLDNKRGLVAEMDGHLIEHLFTEFEKLSAETADGYAPRNAKEAEEVVDAVRKSGEDA